MDKVFFSISDSLGGAEQLIMKLAKNRKETSKICFFKKESTSVWRDAGFDVIYCNGSFIKFIKICKRRNFDFVFSSHLMMNAMLGVLRTIGFLKTKLLICRESTTVFGRYNGIKLFKYKLAYFIGYRQIDLLITQTSLMETILKDKVAFLDNRTIIKTIPNLFEYPKHEVSSINLGFPFIVSAGRLIPEKGFDLLIKAFKEVKQVNPHLKLVILGEGNDRKDLEKLIIDSKLGGEVILKGFVDDVYSYFKAAELCVVSSRREGFPNVLLQMMSQNEKVVSTLCAGDIEKIPGLLTVQSNSIDELFYGIIAGLKIQLKFDDGFKNYLKSRDVESYYKEIFSVLNEKENISS